MRHKRIAAAETRVDAKARAAEKAQTSASRAETAANAQAPIMTEDRDVVPWLRKLGFSVAEAHRGEERCEEFPDASLEQRVRLALSCIGARGTRMSPAGQ